MNKFIVNVKQCLCLFFLLVLFSSVYAAQTISSIKALKTLEVRNHLRIGISALNMKGHEFFNYRADERFAMDSTSKLIITAAVLYKAQKKPGFLNRKILISKDDIGQSGYSPITQKSVGRKVSVASLCMAAIEYSDSTAANLLMSEVGGPKGVTKFTRSIGDETFNLVRREPYLNSAIPGDIRDTTTPQAMLNTVKKLVFGYVLNSSLKKKLIYWMRQCKTGTHRIRSAIPIGWIVGDKTGTGYYGSAGDIAIIWPPKSPPVLISIYISKDSKYAKTPEKVFAFAAKITLHALLKTDLI